ncbi:rhomboid family intramembrane serine protease [Haloprofundus marisrubri]|uniref:Rhomboid family intramembrane serine protease n=1 Tax=Haloprofundus marisrubri TaxID=1514971 RepID=A0A0W1RCK0_9EURY|nr:rhomboid family intramembrane serine protease [Haloprofundus marisrubri]KTG10841.1 rhomboid family intramembrane serine protease [Haloprofundus marisrubri]
MVSRWGSPTLDTLVVFGVVFLVQSFLGLLGNAAGLVVSPVGLFALSPPVGQDPWTLVTSVYAHAGVGHLLSNAVALVVVGFLVEQGTTRWRYHAFFLTTGILAGLAEIGFDSVFSQAVPVVGASGAIFALAGYLLAANPVTDSVLGRLNLDGRGKVILVVAAAALVAALSAGPNIAIVAHGTGFVLGLVAGRLRLLSV